MTEAPVLTGQTIAETQGALAALLEHALDGSGTSSGDYIALIVLAVRGPWASPAALHEFLATSRQLGLDRPAVADLLAKLEADGLVSGTARDDPGPAQLTARGADVRAKLFTTLAPITASVFGGFDPDDLATTDRVLKEVTARAERLCRDM